MTVRTAMGLVAASRVRILVPRLLVVDRLKNSG